ncbi:WD repeat-containing protein 89 [Eupeodes corollae]|uniref:WD repeat-containing protein 89 n=1 Tax=Eupeodes corollae TaxID=290404 RepID=UPI0024907E35|nr:WD repeat-containing protein 89 [Eupeodes corollae]
MPKEEIFNEPESSSDEEDPIIDEDTCNQFEIGSSFGIKYKIASESAVSLKKVYILSLCADKSFGKIAAGLSNNSVQVYDINNRVLSLATNDTLKLKTSGSVCGVRFLDETPTNLLVGSTNGSVSLYDLRTGNVEHSFQDTSDEVKKPITSFDVNANSRVICSGTDQVMNNVYLQFFDVRQKTILGGYFESHQDDVTDVKFHPTNPDLLCTGSTDGLINLFDISATSEDDALTSTINTEESVHKLNWHKNVYEKDVISCITHTNDLKTYECEEGDLIAEFDRTKVTEAIKRKSVADCNLISCHNLSDGGVFVLATSNYNKGEVVRSVQLQGKKLVPHALFDGNKQILRESLHDPTSNLVVTGGESGIVTLWTPYLADKTLPTTTGPNKLKAKSSLAKSHGKGKAPY